ncbi:MAG: NAD(P)H-binding protein [Steroidobacteraceae bacterium]
MAKIDHCPQGRRWRDALPSTALRALSWFSIAVAAASATAAAAPTEGAQVAAPSNASAAPPASAAWVRQLRAGRILVAGGTGRNGSAIVAALEAHGAKPRILARDLAKARERFPGDHDWVEGDVTRAETLAAAVKGIDIIIDAVATSEVDGPNGFEAVDLGGMKNLIAAAKPAGVKRIVLITGATVGRDPKTWPPFLQRGMAIKRETEKALIGSGIDYVVLRPTGITPRPGNAWAIGIYAQSEFRWPEVEQGFPARPQLPPADAPPPPATIARPDLAEVAIVAAVAPQAARRVFVVSHDQGRASAAWARRLGRMPRE